MTPLSPIENLFAVEVPEGLRKPTVKRIAVWGKYHPEHTFNRKIVDLPPGSYEILFTTKGCTEEQAAGVVENDIHPMLDYILGWRDYSFKYENFCLEYAKESLQSLLRANGLQPETNYLLIKKQ